MKLQSLVVRLFIFGAAAVGGAWAQTPANFYQGKQIRVIIGYSPGGGYDTNARVFARFFGKYIPGNPTVLIENMPGASSLKSVEYLAEAPTDGTVITAPSAGLVIQSQIDPEHFPVNLSNYSWLGSISQEIRVCYMRAATGVTNWRQMLARPKTVFGETGTGSAGYIDQSIMRTVLGAHLTTILGYPGSAEKNLAVDRGELDGDCISFTSIPKEWLRDKKINFLYRSSEHLLPGIPPNTPYIYDLPHDPAANKLLQLLLAPTTVGHPWFLSPKVPSDRIAILRKAFDETIKDPDFLAAAAAAQLAIVGPMNGSEASAYIAGAYKVDPATIAAAKKITGG